MIRHSTNLTTNSIPWYCCCKVLILSVLVVNDSTAWGQSHSRNSRRDFLWVASSTAAGATVALPKPVGKVRAATSVQVSNKKKNKQSLAARLDDDILQQLPPTLVNEDLRGVDNFFFPKYMAGTWNVTQTLVRATTPLGPKYLGGPNGGLAIAQKTIAESQSRIDVPVQLQLRFLPTKWGVAEDRLFNTRQRLNAFAGRSVVASIAYADVGACNRAQVLAQGGTSEDPLQTTLVRFKGPAAQKTFLTAHRSQQDLTIANDNTRSITWTGSECLRSIFALTNENTAPPIFTDTEVLWQLTTTAPAQFKDDDDDDEKPDSLTARVRIASYLNAQQDKLYFEARNRAVSLLDYHLDFRRL